MELFLKENPTQHIVNIRHLPLFLHDSLEDKIVFELHCHFKVSEVRK